jgi:hypothetical protein
MRIWIRGAAGIDLAHSRESGSSRTSFEGAVMASDSKFSNPLDQQIYEIHRLFMKVMEDDRLPTISDETKASYLAVFKSLTEKLATPGKPLSEVVGEIMSETAPLLFQVMQR